jgi:hypothetical protein
MLAAGPAGCGAPGQQAELVLRVLRAWARENGVHA